MDNLKTNKILAGFLLAGLLAMGGGKIAEILVPDQALDENAYPVEIKQVADSVYGYDGRRNPSTWIV